MKNINKLVVVGVVLLECITFVSKSQVQITSQTISFTIPVKTYKDPVFTLAATASSGLTVQYSSSNTAIASINGSSVSINGAGTASITAYQGGNATYSSASVTRILIVNKASQNINFGSLANVTFGSSSFVLQASASTGLPILFSTSSILVSINSNELTVTGKGAGVVSIIAYQIGNNNYLQASTTQTFTILPPISYRDRDGDRLIEISTIEQLDSIRYNLTGICNVGTCNGYELMDSLDFKSPSSYRSGSVNTSYTTGSGWLPIGTYSEPATGSSFNAIFEGNGNTIDNLYVNRGTTNNVSFFGYTSNSSIRNIGFRNVSVFGYDFVGGLAGDNYYGIISNSYTTGSVSGNINVGGLVGHNSGSIIQSYATASVSGSSFSIGGLVGDNEKTITGSYATGSVSGNLSIGGLVGNNYEGTITQCYAMGFVSGSEYVGGLVGNNYQATIMQSHATGSVSGSGSIVGGLAGYNDNATIAQSYATGSVSGYNRVGGLVGYNDGYINQSYATGYISGNRFVGGLVGSNFKTISQNYATGSVSGSDVIGGLVGSNAATIHYAYWNKDATQTIKETARSNKLGIGTSTIAVSYVKDFTLSALQSPTGTATDSIRELGPGFIYRQGFLPAIHKGARITVNNINFTQTVPSITNIQTTSTLTNVIQGGTTTRAIITVAGIGFTANFIDTTSGRLKIDTGRLKTPITNIQNGTERGIVGKYQTQTGITWTLIASKTFGDAPFVLTATSYDNAPVLFFASNTKVSIENNTVTINAGGMVNIIARSENDSIMIFTNRILTIYKTSRSVTFEALASKTFGNTSFVLTAMNSESLSILYSASNTLTSISHDTVTIQGAGTVGITAYLDNGNFFGFTTQILTIHKAVQSISFLPLVNRNIEDASFVLHATSSGGLPVLYSSASPLVNISYNVVRMNEAGIVSITAYNNGSSNYLGTSIIQAFTIRNLNNFTKTTPTLIFTSIPNLSIGQSYTLVATSNSHSSITFTSSDTNKVRVKGNTALAKADGRVTITASQEGNIQFNSAIAQQTVTVTVGNIPLTSIEKGNSTIRIHPNPSNDYITIQTDKAQKISSIKMYDLIGVSYELKVMSYELSLRVDLRTLLKGEYIIIVYGEKGEVLKIEKVVIID
ncbi:MAG: GLUG motif-containing protein [Chitinophagaceae bacterium]|nr:GLUG motif-containing protein [Chitinophagaceae bacterium]